MFIVEVIYTAPLTEIDKHVANHRSWLDQQFQKGNFLFSGPQNPRVGGIVISVIKSRNELEELLTQDPYAQNNVAEYKITDFKAIKAHPELQKFIES